MAIDFNRVLEAAVQAAVDGRGSGAQDSRKRRRRGVSGPRAFLIGAGVVAAGRLVAGARRGDMLENLHQRLLDFEDRHFEPDEEPEVEGDEDLEDGDLEEPEAEEDGDLEDEDPGADEDLEDEDLEDEDLEDPEAEEDEDLEEEPAARRGGR